MRVTNISSGKGGGSFKTTVSWTLETWLHKEGYKALLIDNESNGTATAHMGANFTDYPTLYHVYNGDVAIQDTVQRTPMGYVIAGNATNEKIPALFFNDILNGANALKMQLPKLAEMGFTHVIIDNQASVGAIQHVQAMVAASDLVIPYHPDSGTLQGFVNLIKNFLEVRKLNPALRIDGILLGNTRTPITGNERRYVNDVEPWVSYLGTKLYASVIRQAIAVQTAQGNMQSLWEYFPNENVTRDLNSFVLEYMENDTESKIQ
jgi:chromosome partitioning protein